MVDREEPGQSGQYEALPFIVPDWKMSPDTGDLVPVLIAGPSNVAFRKRATVLLDGTFHRIFGQG